MLLNFAFDILKIRKLRQHFNEFMINFHNFRHEKKDNNTITAFVKELLKIHCFHISNHKNHSNLH